jgi:hypothetical protein
LLFQAVVIIYPAFVIFVPQSALPPDGRHFLNTLKKFNSYKLVLSLLPVCI